MNVKGAVIDRVGGKWAVQELDLVEPGPTEVRIKVMASGLCHSDDHLVTGDIPNLLPMVGGHEGSGIVEAVGSAVTRLAVGDHIATAYLPACGVCNWCAQGMQYICNTGAGMENGFAVDGSPRFRTLDGTPVGAMQRLGTFANYLVTDQAQAVKIDREIPFDVAALVSCGVATGWGAAVNGAGVRPRDTTLVVGVGGVGMNAVQGAAHAGAANVIAVDPVSFKREQAEEMGATHSFASIAEAMPLIHSVTEGQGADNAVLTVGVVDGGLIAEAFAALRKQGTLAVVSIGQNEPGIPISPLELVVYAKQLRGVLFGNCNPTRDIPALLDYYRSGHLRLDELITRRYGMDQVNQAYEDMHAGRNIRGVLVHEH
ncbi:S-(hydroxymethyl)glutathione dehydrogenase / alcohol dehydrogenase [Klenkia soli]|uniref:S-(Hydroxymethyl)glutathione dehydrogenase / alcohol dehydrogenase n=1 Tax=Klenkia soli TaxID=1052260 RepID=A0A1H0G4S9_9ACTN|nr:Zn-dependent alcohol dehydrogenase [Klenkia soli]SDO01876.1 S-(hydroxymethyl)glutathione dehydrogenase / alcohol dehydrogenase [Klenkia soli]